MHSHLVQSEKEQRKGLLDGILMSQSYEYTLFQVIFIWKVGRCFPYCALLFWSLCCNPGIKTVGNTRLRAWKKSWPVF